jgi:molecular chaperone GrpE
MVNFSSGVTFLMSASEMSAPLTNEAEPTAEPPDSERKPIDSVEESTPRAAVEETAMAESAMSQPAQTPADQNKEMIQVLGQRVEKMADLLEEANVLSRERERIIDRLHEENQQLRTGELWQAVAPLFRDLVRLYDDLEQTAQRYEGRIESELKDAARDFQSFKDAVVDVLYRHGVERYSASEGSPFNSKEQRALGVVPTQDENLDRAIARVVRAGFRSETRIVRILEAEVFRSTPTVVASPNKEEGAEEKKSPSGD